MECYVEPCLVLMKMDFLIILLSLPSRRSSSILLCFYSPLPPPFCCTFLIHFLLHPTVPSLSTFSPILLCLPSLVPPSSMPPFSTSSFIYASLFHFLLHLWFPSPSYNVSFSCIHSTALGPSFSWRPALFSTQRYIKIMSNRVHVHTDEVACNLNMNTFPVVDGAVTWTDFTRPVYAAVIVVYE